MWLIIATLTGYTMATTFIITTQIWLNITGSQLCIALPMPSSHNKEYEYITWAIVILLTYRSYIKLN